MKNSFAYIRKDNLKDITFLDADIKDFYYKKHSHEEYAFGVINCGQIDFNCRDGYFHIPKGGIMQLNPGDPHEGSPSPETGYNYCMLYIPTHVMKSVMREYACRSKMRDFHFQDNVSNNPLLRHHFIMLTCAMRNVESSDAAVDQAFVDFIQAVISIGQPSNIIRKFNSTCALIKRAEEFIHDNFMNNISLDDVSSEVGLSKYHFMRIFKEHTGFTPYQYIINCKVNEIKKIIDCGEKLSQKINAESFYDLSHLNKRFKEIYGVTPKFYQDSVTK